MDEKKLNEFLGKFMGDAAAALNGLLVDVGDKLGLYKAMAEAGGGAHSAAARVEDGHEPKNDRGVARCAGREWLRDIRPGHGYVLAT